MSHTTYLLYIACLSLLALQCWAHNVLNGDLPNTWYDVRKASPLHDNPPPIPPFPCKRLSAQPPSDNVRKLRFQDIKVMMATGDSISAGFAMKADHVYDLPHLLENLLEYRGTVFDIGGDKDAYTLPNFFQQVHPKNEQPIGASVGQTLPLDAVKFFGHIVQPWDANVTHLNGAQSMARVEHVPAQVDYIVDQLKTTYKDSVDIKKDWKMMTIFIGANNICPACEKGDRSDPKLFEKYLEESLTKIHENIPRVFVNVVTLFNISQVYTTHIKSYYCIFMWDTFCKSECGCITDNSTPADRKKMDEHSVLFNGIIRKLATEWNSKGLDDFYVAVQPFAQNTIIDELYYLSELDCFHPSVYANIGFAVGLWNNLQQKEGEKSTAVTPDIKAMCPDENTYLQ